MLVPPVIIQIFMGFSWDFPSSIVGYPMDTSICSPVDFPNAIMNPLENNP